MVSLKSFIDSLFPGQSPVALGLYVAASAILLFALFERWARRRASFEMLSIFTSLVAVQVDPHLVDYDLTVLLPAGVLASMYIPSARWLIVPL